MVCAVVDACREAGCGRVVVVVGYEQQVVRDALADLDVEFAVQEEQHGTGHAVQCAEATLGVDARRPGQEIFVLCGDGPLIRAETLARVLETHRGAKASATLATSVIEDPTGYGRIVRDAAGGFEAIVEHQNATEEQLAIREVNPSYYCFDGSALFSALDRVERNPVSGEYYVTDVPSILLAEGRVVEVVAAVPPEDVLSINTLEDLAAVDEIYRGRAAARR
jgi:bifunctional N-acetylglucosamine-1-phosphate-uridyltransferase/glucosamine-1-phosphate-acetyltransferase GlmU-like protein